MEKYDHTIVCRDVFGRTGVTGVSLAEDNRAVVVPPNTGGSYDIDQLTELIDAMVAVRQRMPKPGRKRA